nr:UDP-glucuronosyl UDP-glucosyltransferase domain containing protein [Haemonchus contortus]
MSIERLKMLLLLSLLSIAPICDSFKILVINPKFAYSHMNFLGQVADTLVDAGHDVVTLQPLMSTLFASNGTTKSRLIQVGPSAELNELLRIHHASAVKQDIWTSSLRNPFALLAFTTSINDIIYRTTLDVISNEKLLQQLKAEKFDVAITELFEFIGFGVLEAINIKNIIGVHTITSVMERASTEIGNPVIPSYVPASTGVTGDSSDFFARLLNLLFVYTSWKFQSSFASAAEQAMMEKLGPTATPIWDTVSNISWLLVNSEPLLDFDRPTLHKIVPIGGLGVRQPKSLSEEWSRILNIRKRNVLVSFGSVAPTSKMPKEMKQTVLNAIKSHPDITFIWKYDQLDDPTAAGVENLILSKWTPQTDLLGTMDRSRFKPSEGFQARP